MSALLPCPACGRHVRHTESTCPFCTAALPADLGQRLVPGPAPARTRMAQLAALSFVAATSIAGCKDDDTGGAQDAAVPDGAMVDGGSTVALYGIAPVDSGPPDAGGGGVLYGLPPSDAGDGG